MDDKEHRFEGAPRASASSQDELVTLMRRPVSLLPPVPFPLARGRRCLLALIAVAHLLALPACKKGGDGAPAGGAARASDASPGRDTRPTGIPAAAIAHCGVGSPPEMADGCRRAVDAALSALERGADPLDAAIAGVIVLEDDP